MAKIGNCRREFSIFHVFDTRSSSPHHEGDDNLFCFSFTTPEAPDCLCRILVAGVTGNLYQRGSNLAGSCVGRDERSIS